MWCAMTFASFMGMVVSFLIIGYAGDPTLRILGGLLLLVCYTILFIKVYTKDYASYIGKYEKKKR